MPEPDFDQIARQLADSALPVAVVTMPEPPFKTRQQLVDLLAEQLRQVWNARGAADVACLNADRMAGPYMDSLERAIRSLDR